jgi:hypothetical protein
MEDLLILGSFALLIASLGIMHVAVFLMMRVINQDPGPRGKIPLYALLPRMTQGYDPIQRYRAQRGKDSLYRVLQVGWVLFGVGFSGVMSSKLFDWFLHR